MERNLLSNLIRLKLEALDVVVDALPEPIKAQAIRSHRELIEVVHQVTGEYLTEEKAGKDEQNTVQKVNIQ